MADGTILIKWSAPLPVVAVAEAAEAAELVGPAVELAALELLRVHHPRVEPGPVVAEAVEVAAVAVELQQRLQRRKTFSAPNRICSTSPI